VAGNDPAVQMIVDEGERLWTDAKANNDAAMAWYALQCFTGPLIAPEGMVFVPPGEILMYDQPVPVDGFFIDATEVTAQSFQSHVAACVGQGWVMPARVSAAASATDPAAPAILVTYYDALAYAAAQGKDIPTEAQWARAAYGAPDASQAFPWGATWEEGQDPDAETPMEPANIGSGSPAPVGMFQTDKTPYGCYDMAGNVREWTSTPVDGESTPDFGIAMVVRGDGFNGEGAFLNERSTAEFESAALDLGFRCVSAFPPGLAELQTRLDEAPPAP
jgi:formylglycine-generating enzyme required for sulfatase activity